MHVSWMIRSPLPVDVIASQNGSAPARAQGSPKQTLICEVSRLFRPSSRSSTEPLLTAAKGALSQASIKTDISSAGT
jgi:hypothetical protein